MVGLSLLGNTALLFFGDDDIPFRLPSLSGIIYMTWQQCIHRIGWKEIISFNLLELQALNNGIWKSHFSSWTHNLLSLIPRRRLKTINSKRFKLLDRCQASFFTTISNASSLHAWLSVNWLCEEYVSYFAFWDLYSCAGISINYHRWALWQWSIILLLIYHSNHQRSGMQHRPSLMELFIVFILDGNALSHFNLQCLIVLLD